MEQDSVKIALIGFGTVGAGVAKIILKNADHIAHKTGIKLELAHVVDTDLTRERPVQLPDGLLHSDLDKAINDPQVDIAIELVGGTTFAGDLQKRLLAAGKNVVTANKALLAERGQEIYQVARENNRCVAFEASCCGGIPLIGAIRSGLAANKISAMYGIVNGTCNYILSGMSREGKDYATALKEAQDAGFAEADPTLDVNGADSAHKLAILASLAFGVTIDYNAIAVTGIEGINLSDIKYGSELGYAMKLLAIAEQTEMGLSLRVHPAFISYDEPLAQVSGSFNALSAFGDAVGHTSYYGRGAGMMPTASAVVADIIEVAQGNAGRCFAGAAAFGRPGRAPSLCPNEKVSSRFYLRLSVVDQAGVFARIADVLGRNKISISALLQHESESSDKVPVVIMTHHALQGNMEKALEELAQLDVVNASPICIHVVTPPVDE
ncbi:MAG: homoserine dehydrogenase [Sedimentisphaerales bacterium]|nr:homoserine dehydrogenase [Sedimentisphaerales bacterium]